MNLMDKFADPSLMQSLSLSEKLAGAGVTTLMGMGVTFLMLFLLWGCVSLMGAAARPGGSGPSGKSGSAGGHSPSAPEGQLAAVISAAVTAYCSADRNQAVNPYIKIKRIRRRDENSWARIGRWESMR